MPVSPIKRILFFSLLLALTLLGHHFSVSLFFGVDFLFGSIAVLVAIYVLGIWPAVLIAAIGGIYTLHLWGHPYAQLIFTGEALLVGYLVRQRVKSLVLADIIYWIAIGIPLVWLLYGAVMQMDTTQVMLIQFKQAANGIFNAIIAWSLLLLSRLVRQKLGHLQTRYRFAVSIRDVIFTVVLTAIFLPALALIVHENRVVLDDKRGSIQSGLADHARIVEQYLDTMPQQEALNRIDILLQTENDKRKRVLVLMDHAGKAIYSNLPERDYKPLLGSGTKQKLDEKFYIWLPAQGSAPKMKWWRMGQYVHWSNIESGEVYAIIMAQSAAEVIDFMHRRHVDSFILLSVITIIGVALAFTVSHFISRSITNLSTITRNLPARLRSGETLSWPDYTILELGFMRDNAMQMSEELTASWNELKRSHRDLEYRVVEKTADLRESAARNRAIIDYAQEAIITTDNKGVIESVNPATCKIFKHTTNALLGNYINSILPDWPADDGFNDDMLQATSNTYLVLETEGLRADSQRFPVELTISRVALDDRQLFTIILRDITERKEMMRLKDEFISTVSHELRTPMTAIHAAVGMLLHTDARALDKSTMELLEIVQRNSKRLVNLINDILDLQQIESGRIELAIIANRVDTLVYESVEAVQSQAAEKNIKLNCQHIDPHYKVYADRSRLQQILQNLLSNAIKFSGNNERVDIRVNEYNDRITIDIIDYGPGIPEEFHDRVFDKFSQADGSDTRQAGGTGLGLSICKTLTHAMHGELVFETRQGNGTRFSITLPGKRDEDEASAATGGSQPIILDQYRKR